MKAPTEKPTVRKIASLPRDLAERIERFGTDRGMSESAAIRSLLEIALKHLDTQNDLFSYCQAATANGDSIHDIISRILDGHPLVESINIGGSDIIVSLKSKQYFVYKKNSRSWIQAEDDKDVNFILSNGMDY